MLSPSRRNNVPNSSLSYSFSSSPFFDFLEEYHGSPEVPIKVLLLSCGDLPFAVNSKSLCSEQKIENITLTDGSAIVVARNILVAKIITDASFDPQSEDDLQYLWDIHYNMEWSSKTLQQFKKDVTELKEGNFSQKLKIPVANDMEILKNIWNFWSLFAANIDISLMQKIRDQRYESIINHIHGLLSPKTPLPPNFEKPTLAEVWEWLFSQTIKEMDLSHLPGYHARAITEEMRTFFETGNCSKNQEIKVGINPVFLEPKTGQWGLIALSSPYEAYLNLSQLPEKSEFLSSCKSVLSDHITAYRKWLSQEVTMSFHVGDAFELCYGGTWINLFNIVDCSKLPDQLGLANILSAARITLADDSRAIISTHSSPWRDTSSPDRYPSSYEFVEDSLSATIQMIPSLYGLTLMNHVRLGNPRPLRKTWRASVRLQWRRSPCFTNLRIKLEGAIEKFFVDLQRRCFTGSESLKTNLYESFSPLTYCYLLASFTERVELSESDRKSLEEPSLLEPSSKLAWNTLLAWMKGNKILYMKINLTQTIVEEGQGQLRLILASRNGDQVHCFENFDLSRDGDNLKVNFMLLEEHHLELENMVAYLAHDIATSSVTCSCPLSDASSTVMVLPMPYTPKIESTSFLTCLEFEEFYTVGLTGVQHQDMFLSTDRQAPSEAGYQINMTAGTLSCSLTFPWPLKISEVHSTLDPDTEGGPRLILPKSLHEPHPYEWNEQKQWDVTSLKLWNAETLLKDLNFHLSAQFDFKELKRQMLSETENEANACCLKGVREIIRTLFQSSTIDGNVLFVIRSKHDPKLKNLWFLRVHLPVRISPFDSPMLLLTANDHRLAQKLVDRGELDQAQATEDFKRIFVKGVPSSEVCPLFVQSEEEEAVLRYVLRLNATKIIPNNWPIEGVPNGENSPWLSTFVHPYYVDQTGTDADMEDLVATTNKLSVKTEGVNESTKESPLELKVCSKCKQTKENLKRCSRCRSAKYCSVECQRSDWATHKSLCS